MMSLRWLARVLAVLLLIHAWGFVFVQYEMWRQIIEGQNHSPVANAPPPDSEFASEEVPEEIKHAGKLSVASAMPAEPAVTVWYFLGSNVVALILLIGSILPWSKRKRTIHFQRPA